MNSFKTINENREFRLPVAVVSGDVLATVTVDSSVAVTKANKTNSMHTVTLRFILYHFLLAIFRFCYTYTATSYDTKCPTVADVVLRGHLLCFCG